MKKADRLKHTDFISRFFAVNEVVRYGQRIISKCLTPIPEIDKSLSLIGREKILKKIWKKEEKNT